MSTDDTLLPTTDAWGRPVLEDGPRFGPLDGDETSWPATDMLVLTDEDVVTCATGFARAFSSEYFFTIWLIALGEDGWTTKAVAELLDLPRLPPPSHLVRHMLREMTAGLLEVSPGATVVAAIAHPDGGDRGMREVAWTQALVEQAPECGLSLRGIVAVGAHRARMLRSAGADR